MAKTIAKTKIEKPVAKKAPVKSATTTKTVDIEKVSISILEKLKSLNAEPQLQSEIEWCLGSYSHDKNPIGLSQTGERAVAFFQSELAKKTKGITAKFIADIEKAIKA